MKKVMRNKVKYIYLSIILAWKLIEHRIIAAEESIQFVISNNLIIKKRSIITLAIYFLE